MQREENSQATLSSQSRNTLASLKHITGGRIRSISKLRIPKNQSYASVGSRHTTENREQSVDTILKRAVCDIEMQHKKMEKQVAKGSGCAKGELYKVYLAPYAVANGTQGDCLKEASKSQLDKKNSTKRTVKRRSKSKRKKSTVNTSKPFGAGEEAGARSGAVGGQTNKNPIIITAKTRLPKFTQTRNGDRSTSLTKTTRRKTKTSIGRVQKTQYQNFNSNNSNFNSYTDLRRLHLVAKVLCSTCNELRRSVESMENRIGKGKKRKI